MHRGFEEGRQFRSHIQSLTASIVKIVDNYFALSKDEGGETGRDFYNSWTAETSRLIARSEQDIYWQVSLSNRSMNEIITVIVILSAGITMIAYSIKPFRKLRAIKKSDEISISATLYRGDMVQISGTVIGHDDSIKSPIEGKECVAYEYKISKTSRDSADPENDHYWKDLEKRKGAVDFMLEDHTGTAHIHSNDSEISLTHDSRYTISDSSSVPTTVTGDPIPFDPTNFEFKDRLRFSEGTIRPGDWISVIGIFSESKTEDREDVEITSDEIAYIFDKDTEDKISSLQKKAINTFIFGFVFASFAGTYVVLELL